MSISLFLYTISASLEVYPEQVFLPLSILDKKTRRASATIVIFLVGGDRLIELYLHGEGARENVAATLLYGKQYLWIMLVGLPPFMMVQVYASTLRECGETVVPMKAGITAVLINLLFNYILIYGKFGAPVL